MIGGNDIKQILRYVISIVLLIPATLIYIEWDSLYCKIGEPINLTVYRWEDGDLRIWWFRIADFPTDPITVYLDIPMIAIAAVLFVSGLCVLLIPSMMKKKPTP